MGDAPGPTRRLVVIFEPLAADRENAVTAYLAAKGWHVWHWIADSWLLAGVPADVTPRSLWDDIGSLPGLDGLERDRGIIFDLGDPPTHWGRCDPRSWTWLGLYWGRCDFPAPAVTPDLAPTPPPMTAI